MNYFRKDSSISEMSEQLYCYRERTLPNGKKVIVREAFNERDAEGVLAVMPQTPEGTRNGQGPRDPSAVVDRLLRMTEEGKARIAAEEAIERVRVLEAEKAQAQAKEAQEKAARASRSDSEGLSPKRLVDI